MTDSPVAVDTTEENTAIFRRALQELEETIPELAKRMSILGDHRSTAVIIRSIRRMEAGETSVSGEMLVIVKMLLRQQRQRQICGADVVWREGTNGLVWTQKDGFSISLNPQTKGRWLVHLEHIESRYSPSWPKWQVSLEAAKQKALTCLDDARIELDEFERGKI